MYFSCLGLHDSGYGANGDFRICLLSRVTGDIFLGGLSVPVGPIDHPGRPPTHPVYTWLRQADQGDIFCIFGMRGENTLLRIWMKTRSLLFYYALLENLLKPDPITYLDDHDPLVSIKCTLFYSRFRCLCTKGILSP